MRIFLTAVYLTAAVVMPVCLWNVWSDWWSGAPVAGWLAGFAALTVLQTFYRALDWLLGSWSSE